MFKSKTFWTSIAAIATTAGLYMSHEISLVEALTAVFAAVQVINVRHTIVNK